MTEIIPHWDGGWVVRRNGRRTSTRVHTLHRDAHAELVAVLHRHWDQITYPGHDIDLMASAIEELHE